MEEGEEQSALVSKELREKSREFELLKRSYAEAQRAVQLLQVRSSFRVLKTQNLILCQSRPSWTNRRASLPSEEWC